jgi:hypothetical protein
VKDFEPVAIATEVVDVPLSFEPRERGVGLTGRLPQQRSPPPPWPRPPLHGRRVTKSAKGGKKFNNMPAKAKPVRVRGRDHNSPEL